MCLIRAPESVGDMVVNAEMNDSWESRTLSSSGESKNSFAGSKISWANLRWLTILFELFDSKIIGTRRWMWHRLSEFFLLKSSFHNMGLTKVYRIVKISGFSSCEESRYANFGVSEKLLHIFQCWKWWIFCKSCAEQTQQNLLFEWLAAGHPPQGQNQRIQETNWIPVLQAVLWHHWKSQISRSIQFGNKWPEHHSSMEINFNKNLCGSSSTFKIGCSCVKKIGWKNKVKFSTKNKYVWTRKNRTNYKLKFRSI